MVTVNCSVMRCVGPSLLSKQSAVKLYNCWYFIHYYHIYHGFSPSHPGDRLYQSSEPPGLNIYYHFTENSRRPQRGCRISRFRCLSQIRIFISFSHSTGNSTIGFSCISLSSLDKASSIPLVSRNNTQTRLGILSASRAVGPRIESISYRSGYSMSRRTLEAW
ncbi:hypothetical protein BDW62DRAFT_30625 [Aspergillus aurantiobrunneus]